MMRECICLINIALRKNLTTKNFMMRNIFLYSFLLLIGVSLASCGGGVDCDDEQAVADAFTNGFSDVLTASLAFDNDPNDANCQSLISAIDSWINNLEDFEDCADEFGQGDEFRETINEARADLSDLPCG